MAREYKLSFRAKYPESIQKRLLCILSIGGLCLVSYLWGAGVWQNSSPTTMNHSEMYHRTSVEADSTSPPPPPPSSSSSLSNSLEVESHHQVTINDTIGKAQRFPPCNMKYSEYTPCQDNKRGRRFSRDMMVYRERHCPAEEELLFCLIPAPPKYKKPFKWPLSRDYAWYDNIPHNKLTVTKAVQNWVQADGDKFIFPGGGTMFPHGADAYIDDINELIPLNTGEIRTALDTGCGVASWGAYLLKRNTLAMSFAPRDSHEAQVQFALERGIPAMIGVMASQKLPYPARAFDVAHCSRCLIPWYKYDGLYLIEVDRVLRPGGYWVLSGPPIMWKERWRGWERSKVDLKQEQDVIEEMARRLCWRKVIEKDNLAIWQKPINHIDCTRDQKMHNTTPICKEEYPDAAWYKTMKTCITPLPEVNDQNEVAGGGLEKWPRRAFTLPPRIRSGSIPGLTSMNFQKDNEAWKKIVSYYQEIIPFEGQYRNIMDMNAYLGGFAAALIEYPVWVMNVVPVDVKEDTLGAIYERGFIGTYQDWCEAFSTYPRTYDLIHAAELISLYKNRCNIANILLEMDRILRPEGAVIFRDSVEALVKIQSIIERMRWKSQIKDYEDGPFNSEKILVAVKEYWTVEAIKEV